MSASGLFSQVTTFGFLAVLFGSIDSIAGWDFHEMLILVAYMRISGALVALGWDGIWSMGQMVVEGDLDYRITRPAPVVLQVGTSHIGLQAFGDLLVAGAMLVYGWHGAGIGPDPAAIGSAALLMACATAIQLSLMTSLNCICFWIKGRATPFAFTAVELEGTVGHYPMDIYPAVAKALLTFGLPFAFINFIPAQIVTDRLSATWILAPVAAALTSLAIMGLVLKAGLRSYESAGH
ncbi:ABC transporter permease [Glycomyces salinus]|uniref:ABC transporter permease n=1 Tax=Glycomyces salinus TaxID=980294 RepID=UPI0018ED4AB6|nr:ABC-2 family transporter protein [Glycomyces salinus]